MPGSFPLPQVADPLGGSFYVEALTSQMEAAAERVIAEVEQLGGMTEAIISGENWPRPPPPKPQPHPSWALRLPTLLAIGCGCAGLL